MFTWGPFGERGFSLDVVVVPPGVVEFEVGDEPDGPSISAPITNAGPVEWAFSSTPSGLSSDPASGTLAPGASVTPTLSALAAGVYAAAIANTTTGGTVNGADAPGDGGEYTVSAGGPPPPPPPWPGEFLEGSVDFTGYGYAFPFPTEYFEFVGAYSRLEAQTGSLFYGTEPSCEFVPYPGSLGCYAGLHIVPGSSCQLLLNPDEAYDGGVIRALVFVFFLEHRPTEDRFIGEVSFNGAEGFWTVTLDRTDSGDCTIALSGIGNFPETCAELRGTHSLRVEFDSPNEGYAEASVYLDDVLVVSGYVATSGFGLGVGSLSPPSSRQLIQLANNGGSEGLFTINSIAAANWPGGPSEDD